MVALWTVQQPNKDVLKPLAAKQTIRFDSHCHMAFCQLFPCNFNRIKLSFIFFLHSTESTAIAIGITIFGSSKKFKLTKWKWHWDRYLAFSLSFSLHRSIQLYKKYFSICRTIFLKKNFFIEKKFLHWNCEFNLSNQTY